MRRYTLRKFINNSGEEGEGEGEGERRVIVLVVY
jgi:hypothetical protein